MINAEQIRELLELFGTIRTQTPDEWTGPFPLPTELADFYRDIGPVDVYVSGYGNDYYIPSLAQLWPFQAGYRFDSERDKDFADWDDDWIVVACEGPNPFICSRRTGEILMAMHGMGSWEPERIFDSIEQMAFCLAALGGVVRDLGDSLTDDDCNLTPTAIDRATIELCRVLPSEQRAKQVLSALGLC